MKPRKTPIQARSTATVDAILEATLQVLLEVGKERLNTTRVAIRAGVSVGTLYQYFPNKSALLQAVLRNHLGAITAAVEQACRDQHGSPAETMVSALISTFVQAKLSRVEASVALYLVSDDVEGAEIVRQTGDRLIAAITAMLRTAQQPLTADARLVAIMLQGAMIGVSRRMLESGQAKEQFEQQEQELILMARTYVLARVAGSTTPPPKAPRAARSACQAATLQ